ncbi:MAG: DUF6352 family protein [Hyphomicrobiales bacterium]
MTHDAQKLPDFWITSGAHLLKKNDASAWIATPDFVRAYFSRPELAPVDESCAAEISLHKSLSDDPMQHVEEKRVRAIADRDVQDNYLLMLAFRDLLIGQGSLEAAYLSIVRGEVKFPVPPLFVDQLVHVILRNILDGETDPLRLRAAEIFFRDQNVSTDDGRVMLADDEIVEMKAQSENLGGLGQLLKEAGTPAKQVELDVLDEDNKNIYWERSDRFDTVIDFRFTQPALDAFARVVEAWIGHFLRITVRVQPMQNIKDEKWRWHVGLDAEATKILNRLYEGGDVSLDEIASIIGLFRMVFEDNAVLQDDMHGKPIYLAVAKTPAGKLKLKPQNLLVNLPLAGGKG